MKTAEEKADNLVKSFDATMGYSLDEREERILYELVRQVLNQQDKESRIDQDYITRCACAESASQCPQDMSSSNLIRNVQVAVMNTKAV